MGVPGLVDLYHFNKSRLVSREVDFIHMQRCFFLKSRFGNVDFILYHIVLFFFSPLALCFFFVLFFFNDVIVSGFLFPH